MTAVIQTGAFMRSSTRRVTLIERAVMGLALLMLVFQLISIAHHKHTYEDNHLDCASCQLIQHLPAGVPPADAGIVGLPVTLLYHLPACASPVVLVFASFLIPDSQAPPSRFISR